MAKEAQASHTATMRSQRNKGEPAIEVQSEQIRSQLLEPSLSSSKLGINAASKPNQIGTKSTEKLSSLNQLDA